MYILYLHTYIHTYKAAMHAYNTYLKHIHAYRQTDMHAYMKTDKHLIYICIRTVHVCIHTSKETNIRLYSHACLDTCITMSITDIETDKQTYRYMRTHA